MPVTQHPLHRSVRAALPHTALALGRDEQTLVRIRVADVRGRQPAIDQARHATPGQVMAVAAATQGAMPQPPHLSAERPQPRAVTRHAEVVRMAPTAAKTRAPVRKAGIAPMKPVKAASPMARASGVDSNWSDF